MRRPEVIAPHQGKLGVLMPGLGAVPVLLALVGSMFVPYVRARGESLQSSGAAQAAPLSQVGWLQRPERVVLLATTVAVAPAFDLVLPASAAPMHWLTVGGVLLVAVGTQVTAVQRTLHLVRALTVTSPEVEHVDELVAASLAVAGTGPARSTRKRASVPVTSSASRARASRSASWLRGH